MAMTDPDDYDMRQVQDDHERWVMECELDKEYLDWLDDIAVIQQEAKSHE